MPLSSPCGFRIVGLENLIRKSPGAKPENETVGNRQQNWVQSESVFLPTPNRQLQSSVPACHRQGGAAVQGGFVPGGSYLLLAFARSVSRREAALPKSIAEDPWEPYKGTLSPCRLTERPRTHSDAIRPWIRVSRQGSGGTQRRDETKKERSKHPEMPLVRWEMRVESAEALPWVLRRQRDCGGLYALTHGTCKLPWRTQSSK